MAKVIGRWAPDATYYHANGRQAERDAPQLGHHMKKFRHRATPAGQVIPFEVAFQRPAIMKG